MKRGQRKTAVGIVTSDKMDKTITVQVDRRVIHPRFKKYITLHSRHKAHDPGNEAHEGDTVQIVETRPLSKTKRWRLAEIVRRVHGAGVAADAAAEAAPAADAPADAPAEAQGAEGAS